MWVGFALSVAAGLATNLDVAAPAPCPTEHEVEQELIRLGAERGPRPAITITDDIMRVVLRSQDGTTLGSPAEDHDILEFHGCKCNACRIVGLSGWLGASTFDRLCAAVVRRPSCPRA